MCGVVSGGWCCWWFQVFTMACLNLSCIEFSWVEFGSSQALAKAIWDWGLLYYWFLQNSPALHQDRKKRKMDNSKSNKTYYKQPYFTKLIYLINLLINMIYCPNQGDAIKLISSKLIHLISSNRSQFDELINLIWYDQTV